MNYTHRLATPADSQTIAPLWKEFAIERQNIDPSMKIKPNFDFEKYVTHQLSKPLSFGYVLEYETNNQIQIVGCILVYCYDEAPPPDLPAEFLAEHELENPFLPRRVGSVLGLYVQPEHRLQENILLLVTAAIKKAELMQVSDIDVLIAADQKGIQAFLKRSDFTPAAVQFTKHYDISNNTELPSLHPPHPDLDLPKPPLPGAMALRDIKTNELVYNKEEKPVFIYPLTDSNGELIKTSNDMPVYPNPLQDPQTQDWVFDTNGDLVVSPILQDEKGQVFEYQGLPQFHPPCYKMLGGKLILERDDSGNYLFRDVERDSQGKIVLSPEGQPIFKQNSIN
ncbi:hypothetical protein [Okeania sp. KiyG1]|uniref:hypothetical protein n=1 Tax=Okeania sp. KiyG1 TaxID=2720165 RepID=UPI0019246143|nr:hypothetical protein [Okeania sp. KiyG1]GGA27657.1 hypothetical protein CYANOKiyG1_43850 [Okeania sp. KiyG1]